jgi:hypothetical protein
MDRIQRWGNKAEQREARERYQRPPRHAHIPLRVLRCADCQRVLSSTHPAELGDRCGWCWEALMLAEEVGVYV